ncbi:MAG TPA: hypothetical protein VEB88_01695 [Candidatus Acidoferrales bacterium]|nr:hypothetical protein [Candidatus Acidoferrales bacterium]
MTNESGEIDVTQAKNLDVTANPAAFKLTAFGITTALVKLSNAGYFALGSMLPAMRIFYGGLVQVGQQAPTGTSFSSRSYSNARSH